MWTNSQSVCESRMPWRWQSSASISLVWGTSSMRLSVASSWRQPRWPSTRPSSQRLWRLAIFMGCQSRSSSGSWKSSSLISSSLTSSSSSTMSTLDWNLTKSLWEAYKARYPRTYRHICRDLTARSFRRWWISPKYLNSKLTETTSLWWLIRSRHSQRTRGSGSRPLRCWETSCWPLRTSKTRKRGPYSTTNSCSTSSLSRLSRSNSAMWASTCQWSVTTRNSLRKFFYPCLPTSDLSRRTKTPSRLSWGSPNSSWARKLNLSTWLMAPRSMRGPWSSSVWGRHLSLKCQTSSYKTLRILARSRRCPPIAIRCFLASRTWARFPVWSSLLTRKRRRRWQKRRFKP